MTALIDTHCHLADPKFAGDLDDVIARARAGAIARIIAVGAIGSIDADRRTVEIAERYENIFAVIGVHPHDAKDCDDARIAALRALARSQRVVAIGESGLDFHYMHSPREAQEEALRRHLALARELSRPIVIHCRDAEARIAEIVAEQGLPPAGGAIHCFTGEASAAARFVELGFHISFSGILTFKSARDLRAAAKVPPEDRLMVETDAPYLAPEPFRGQRNEPAFVRRTLEVLAAARGAEPDALAARIVENAARLFNLPE
jgi:TatD DNase family protein